MASLRRRLGLAVLTGYALLLVLAAWPSPLRPALLERPHHTAAWLLRLVGTVAGQPIFRMPEATEQWVRVACLHVRGRGPAGEAIPRWPPGGACRTEGVRFRLPPRERAYFRILEARALSDDPFFTGTFSGVGEHFCHEAGPAAQAVELVWYVYFVRYESGALEREPLLHFRWDCGGERPSHLRWGGDEAALVAFWGSEPWR